jgi:hypothetical protein
MVEENLSSEESPKEEKRMRFEHVDERIILKWILKQQGGRVYTGFTLHSIDGADRSL